MAEEAPGVITLNMRAASACVIEFLARLFPFRQFPNEARARSIFMLAEGDEDTFAESQFTAGEPLSGGIRRDRPAAWIAGACAATEGRMKRRPLWWRRIVAAARRHAVRSRSSKATCCPRSCRSGISSWPVTATKTGP